MNTQLDDFKRMLGMDDEIAAAAPEPMTDAEPEQKQKSMKKKVAPTAVERTSISVSRRTAGRLNSFAFWQERQTGDKKNFDTLISDLLEFRLQHDSSARAFLEAYGPR